MSRDTRTAAVARMDYRPWGAMGGDVGQATVVV